MLTPVELQNKTFKSGGLGYDKKDVEQFFREVTDEYTRLYSENIDLKDRVDALNEALQRYKTIESTLQKALVLAQKTAEDTTQAALKNARNIEKEAQLKSQIIVADARNELEHVRTQTLGLLQQFEKYKAQFKSLAVAQIELLDSESYSLNVDKLDASMDIGHIALPRREEEKEQEDMVNSSSGLSSFGGMRGVERPERKTAEKSAVERTIMLQKKAVEQRTGRGEEITAGRAEERTNEQKGSRNDIRSMDRADGLGGIKPLERAEKRLGERMSERAVMEQRSGMREEIADLPEMGQPERNSINRNEGSSYWPDGRFPGRAVGKTTIFEAKTSETEDTSPKEEDNESEGFDFIDL